MAGLRALSRFGLAVSGAWALAKVPSEPLELSAAQRDSVDRGDLVMIAEQRAESPWPAVMIYGFIEATPEQATASFMDYESHAEFVPKLLKAKISRVIDRATVEVDYTVAVPVFPDEDYTIRNHITRAGTDAYRVDWILVRATTTKATVGHALFTPYVNKRSHAVGTLLEYYNFVTPGSKLAGLPFIRSRSIHQIRETVKSIVQQVEKERGRDPEMRPRVTALRSALAP